MATTLRVNDDGFGVALPLEGSGRLALDLALGLKAAIVAHLPRVGSALLTLLLLWLVARLARSVTERVLRVAKLDDVTEGTLLGRVLAGLGAGLTASKATAALVYGVILLLAVAAAADTLGLTAVHAALFGVLGYVPKLLSGLAVLAVGGFVARAARRTVGSVLKEIKSPYAGIAESLTETLIMLVTVSVAVNVFGADLSFVTNNLAMILGVLVVTMAFLFGWSMRRPAEEIIANYYLRRLVRIGDRITVADVEGTVDRFAALGIVIKDEDAVEHFVPAHRMLNGLQRVQPAKLVRPSK